MTTTERINHIENSLRDLNDQENRLRDELRLLDRQRNNLTSDLYQAQDDLKAEQTVTGGDVFRNEVGTFVIITRETMARLQTHFADPTDTRRIVALYLSAKTNTGRPSTIDRRKGEVGHYYNLFDGGEVVTRIEDI